MALHLSSQELEVVQSILKQYSQIDQAMIFGSRAMDTHRKGSDVDLALFGPVSFSKLNTIKSDFEESTLPYFVDVIVYDNITNMDLKKHIDAVGVVCYKRE